MTRRPVVLVTGVTAINAQSGARSATSRVGSPLPTLSEARSNAPPRALAAARRLSSGDRYASIPRLRAAFTREPKAQALLETTYFAGLRKAGMPEE